jgi:4-aminobutyrate aminotransferase/(S)-3-amino-2-methylpropionate transaminase
MLAVELVQAGTTQPDGAKAQAIAQACHADGLLVLTCGTYGNVLRFLPPLVIDEPTLLRGLEVLERAVTQVG